MGKIRVSIEEFKKVFSPEQQKELQLPLQGELEVEKTPQGWVVQIPSSTAFELLPIHTKVLKLFRARKDPDRIEGRFEQFLTEEERKAFGELVANGKIVKFKGSEKYSKALYQEPVPGQPVQAIPSAPVTPMVERAAEEYSLQADGFMMLRSEGAAKVASFDLSERIRAGEIRGIRSFDGFYYIIENDLLQKHLTPALGFIQRHKKVDIATLAQELNITRVLVRVMLEFAKEDGVVIEKQKDTFQWVG